MDRSGNSKKYLLFVFSISILMAIFFKTLNADNTLEYQAILTVPVFVAVLLKNNFEFAKIVKIKLNIVYLSFFILTIIISIISAVTKISPEKIELINLCLNALFSFLVLMFINEEFNREFAEKIKWLLKYLLIFVGLILLSNILTEMVVHEKLRLVEFLNIFAILLIKSPMIFLSICLYSAQEYGWRQFFLPKLQEHFGKRAGIFLTSILWAVLYAVVLLILESGVDEIYVLSEFVSVLTLGIFLGYVYTKTKNLLALVLVRGVSATLLALIEVSVPKENLTTAHCIVYMTITLVMFMSFFLKKDLKEKEEPLRRIYVMKEISKD